MPKKQPEIKEKEKPENNQELKTKPLKEKIHEEEEKPSFQDLLRKGKNDQSSPPGGVPGDGIELDENIVEICKDIITVPFEIWNKINPKVEPLSEDEKKHISQPLARIAVKYDVAKYMKDEFLLCAFLGFAIYKRSRIPKDDKNDHREKGQGKDEPNPRTH